MKLENPVTSILSELLGLIKTFACLRHHLLLKNLNHVESPGYLPQDLPVTAFAEALHVAINEYILHQRLVFCDSDEIHFGQNGSLTIKRKVDLEAQALLSNDKEAYLKLMETRIHENNLSEKATQELLCLLQKATAQSCSDSRTFSISSRSVSSV